jgi:hypothetical protein
MCNYMTECMLKYALTYEWKEGKERKETLVWARNKFVRSRPNSWSNSTTLWNQQVKTDKNIPNNKPDATIRGNEKEQSY